VSLPAFPPDLAREASTAFGNGGFGALGAGAPIAKMTRLGEVSVALPSTPQPSTVLLELQRPAGPVERIRALAQPLPLNATDRIYRATPPESWLASGGALVPVAVFGGKEVRGSPLPLAVAPSAAPTPSLAPSAATPGPAAYADLIAARFAARLQFLARVRVQLKEPVTIGKTPEGLRIDFVVRDGTAKGEGFNADVLENTVDYMVVRADGIGLINVHALLRTDDGAMLTAAYTGMVDFGPNGYEKMASRNYPKLSPMQLAPRLLTEDPRYAWMNKAYLLGVGYADLEHFVVTYDAYAVTTITGAVPTP